MVEGLGCVGCLMFEDDLRDLLGALLETDRSLGKRDPKSSPPNQNSHASSVKRA